MQGVSKEREAKSENLHGCRLYVRSSRFRESICPSIYLSDLFTVLRSINLSVYLLLFIDLSIYPSLRSVYLFSCFSIYLLIYVFICVTLCLSISLYIRNFLSIYQSVYLSIYLFYLVFF